MSEDLSTGGQRTIETDIQCIGNEPTVADCSLPRKSCGWHTRLTCRKGIEQ